MNELSDLYDEPAYRATVEKLQSVKRISPTGVAYWLARDICPILGYSWEGFEAVIARAEDACAGIKVDPRHHFSPPDRASPGHRRSGPDRGVRHELRVHPLGGQGGAGWMVD